MLQELQETVEFIKEQTKLSPKTGVILGTGLGALVDEIETEKAIPYTDIPNFPVSTVEGHAGTLLFGHLAEQPVVCMQGRFHYYEGYSMQEITFPVRVMKMLGIELLVLSNASGGVNPGFKVGDVMIVTDHIDLVPDNPLRGPNIDELGPRFPDMSEPYDKAIIKQALEIARANDINVQTGVYTGLPGPTYETPAEYIFVRQIGSDAVGMSTVPEVITARHMGIPCFAMSVITDLGVPGKIEYITHKEVQQVAEETQPKMTLIVKQLIATLNTV